MNCRETREWISPYLDSELDPKTTFQVSQHLEGCPGCRQRFEQETHAERLIVDTLRRYRPGLEWSAIEPAITAPRRIRLWRSAGILAAAACITLVVLGVGGWPRESHAARWAVQELNRAQPDCGPFTDVGTCTMERVNEVSREILHQDFPLDLDTDGDGRSDFVLVDVRSRVCPKGKPRVEVRMNCCGKPVLLTVARERCLGQLKGVCKQLNSCRSREWVSTDTCAGVSYNVAATRRGDVVLVAVSPDHPVLRHVFRGCQ